MTEEEKKIVNATKQLVEDIVILSGGVRDFSYGNMNIRISTVDTLIKIIEKLEKKLNAVALIKEHFIEIYNDDEEEDEEI